MLKILICLFFSLNAFSFISLDRFSTQLEYKFDLLPSSGKLEGDQRPWPGNHWPGNTGSIASRWSQAKPVGFDYKTYSLEELKALAPHKINALSPAEKYDIYMGRFDYPTVKKVWRMFSPLNPDWFGICQGAAIASTFYKEPQSVEVQTKDELNYTFYTSDIKALLSYFHAKKSMKRAVRAGKRCKKNPGEFMWAWEKKACSDINAGEFHVLVSNYVGLMSKSLIIEAERYEAVANHPLEGYSYDIYGTEQTEYGTRYWIGMSIKFPTVSAPYFDPIVGTSRDFSFGRNYQYYLDVDSEGNIIGGEWITKDRPDFIWTQEKTQFWGYWQGIGELYERTAR